MGENVLKESGEWAEDDDPVRGEDKNNVTVSLYQIQAMTLGCSSCCIEYKQRWAMGERVDDKNNLNVTVVTVNRKF